MNRTQGPQLALKPAPELAFVARVWLVVFAELERRAALAGPGPDVAQEPLQQHVQPRGRIPASVIEQYQAAAKGH